MWWRSLLSKEPSAVPTVKEINRLREHYARMPDGQVDQAARTAVLLPEVIALAAVIAARVLGVQMFDEQIAGALGLVDGKIIEMQTGEGKTLAAVPAIAWLARDQTGVHVLTANDYLARRDADWMRAIYERMGLSVAAIDQSMDSGARRAAYAANITYATANEVGFDYLRDGLAMDPADRVHRPFSAAVVDEADSILIDEARIPLVIAGGSDERRDVAVDANRVAGELVAGRHFTIDGEGRNVALTAAGVSHVERGLGCDNLFAPAGLEAHTAVQDALHAHVLLRRDVDYVVADDAVLPVDEFKGRIVADRRWPAGLQTALEHKEAVRRKPQGRVLGSITVEHLLALYPRLCGMTGTAATQAEEFRECLRSRRGGDPHTSPGGAGRSSRRGLRVQSAQGERPFATRSVGCTVTGVRCSSARRACEESERLSRALADVPHQVLNARHAAVEAGDHRERRRTRRRHDLDEHGRTRRRHPARRRRRGPGRAARHRHEPARQPAHRSSTARTRRPAGRSWQLAVLRLGRGSADG